MMAWTPPTGSAAFAVLSNPELFRAIASWPAGWPARVAERWHAIRHPRIGLTPNEFMCALASNYDLRTLELTKQVAYRPDSPRHEFVVKDLQPLIKDGDANAVRLALEYSVTANTYLRRAYWALAIDKFPGHCEVLDELDTFEPLDEEDLSVCATTWGRTMVNIDSVALAQWLIENVGAQHLPKTMLQNAATRGHVDLVRFLSFVEHQHFDPQTFHQIYRLAHQDKDSKTSVDTSSTYTAILMFLLQHRDETHTRELELEPFEVGDCATLELILHARGFAFLPGVNIDQSAARGHLEVIHLLATNTDVSCTTDAMDQAAANGHLHVVMYLHEVKIIACTAQAMDNAATNGHLDIVQFLHHNRTEGCTTKAMDAAAANGRLDIVQFLHDHRHEGCTTNAMDDAARNLYLNVAQYLHHNRPEGCTSAALIYPKSTKHKTIARKILLFLLEHRKEMHPKSVEEETVRRRDLEVLQMIQRTRGLQYVDGISLDDIASEGNLPLIEFLVEHTTPTCTVTAMDSAAARGHFDVVRYLHETRTEGCSTAAMDMAATFQHWGIVAFLDEHRTEGCTSVVLNAAVQLGRMDLVERYCKRVPPLGRAGAAYVAAAYGHYDIQAYLKNYTNT